MPPADNLCGWVKNVEEEIENGEKEAEYPKPSVQSLRALKDFIRDVALGMNGQKGYEESDSSGDEDEWIPPGVESVRNYWNNFTGAWRREYATEPISMHYQKSVTQASFYLLIHNNVAY